MAYRLFSQALDVEAAAREEFVRQSCAGNLALEQEVAALLAEVACDPDAAQLLLIAEPLLERNLVGQEYGRFRLVELIGSGGMGVVYRAERTDGVPQAVALKLVRGEITTASRARFISEARLLARLEHPAIARLIDVGVREGEGWIAMELVCGRPIDEYCEAHHLGVRERVALLALIADAVATAHRMLVVHRDIKPTNVLVSEDGRPKLIDFGIATTLNAAAEAREPTADIRRLFTPHYAAPEQVSGEPVTVATDVFGLGALAYRVLTGVVPFQKASGVMGYLLAVTQQDVLAPSRAGLAAGMEMASARKLRGDLDAILMKALERDTARRYAGAQDFQFDLQRYLNGLPVSARAPTWRYRASRLIRRRALSLGLAATLTVALIVGGVISALQLRATTQARNTAARRGEFLERMMESANPTIGHRDVTVAELLDSASKQLSSNSDDDPLSNASLFQLIAETNYQLGRYSEGLGASDHALALLRHYDGRSIDIGDVLATRGQLLRRLGRNQEGEAPLREAIQRLTGVRNQEAKLAEAYDDLGIGLAQSSKEKEAEAAYRTAISLYGSIRSARIGYPLGNLAVLIASQARYQESESLAERSLAELQKFLPPEHPDILGFRANQAGFLVNDHRAKDAEPVFRQIWEARLRVLGPDHVDTQLSALSLADDLTEQHRYAEAAAIAGPAAKHLEQLVGSDHQWTLYGFNEFGAAACASGRGGEGLEALQRVEIGRAKRFGPDDWHTTSTQIAIGSCFVHLKRFAEAESELLRSVKSMEKARGAAFFRTQAGYQSLHDLYTEMGRSDDARFWDSKLQTSIPSS